MTDVKREIQDAGDDGDLLLRNCEVVLGLLEDLKDDRHVDEPMTRRTLDTWAVLLICLRRELMYVQKNHARMWKAANQATGREPVEDAEPKA